MPCDVAAFVTFAGVIATSFGALLVAAMTYQQVRGFKHYQLVTKPLSGRAIGAVLAFPWLKGVIFAAVVGSQGLLGSYQGLYCYTNQ